MKNRNGFVSNSSSSSFIVKKEDKLKAKEFGLQLVSVKDIKAKLAKIDQKKKEIAQIQKDLGDMGLYFMREDYGYTSYSVHYLEMAGLEDEDYITEPFDRDEAYMAGIKFNVFEGDL